MVTCNDNRTLLMIILISSLNWATWHCQLLVHDGSVHSYIFILHVYAQNRLHNHFYLSARLSSSEVSTPTDIITDGTVSAWQKYWNIGKKGLWMRLLIGANVNKLCVLSVYCWLPSHTFHMIYMAVLHRTNTWKSVVISSVWFHELTRATTIIMNFPTCELPYQVFP